MESKYIKSQPKKSYVLQVSVGDNGSLIHKSDLNISRFKAKTFIVACCTQSCLVMSVAAKKYSTVNSCVYSQMSAGAVKS